MVVKASLNHMACSGLERRKHRLKGRDLCLEDGTVAIYAYHLMRVKRSSDQVHVGPNNPLRWETKKAAYKAEEDLL